ncbi:MAG: argininosuccinate lyase, partial [Firmicutes bacterium]|nr:argininosuccinate lyase [Bacillota bacterium]
MFIRDYERLTDCYDRMNYSPLGAGALAGTTYETDRHFVAAELGFAGVCLHGMDAVSDRDFIIEFISAAAVCMMHLSRFCEELIIWSTSEFNFIEMDDAYSTGSSIMPQKKNPDLAELIRGKTGRVYGNLFNILTIMKALPLAYNKDMQEDKLPLFDTVDTVSNSITVFIDMITTMQINKKSMSQAAKTGFMNATDAADYLVKKGLPFRECHAVIGRIVLYCLNKQVAIEDLSLAELNEFSDKFEEDFYQNITIEACVNAKKSAGSTSHSSIVEMVRRTRAKLISM